MSHPSNGFLVVSDVYQRDGIGVEIYHDDQLIVEIFRDDSERSRTITLFTERISLELMEEAIQIFKKEIPWNFIDDE